MLGQAPYSVMNLGHCKVVKHAVLVGTERKFAVVSRYVWQSEMGW